MRLPAQFWRSRPGADRSQAEPPDPADEVVAQLAAKVPTAGAGIVYTADDDPNHLLGRPNGYTSKATFVDTRIESGPPPGSVDAGGSVEVFGDASAAAARQQYIQQLQKASPLLGTEYSYVEGPALVRVSGKLTPTEAAEYEAAAASG
jgi:hypothetical protein